MTAPRRVLNQHLVDPPLLYALKRGDTLTALNLLQDPSIDILEESGGLSAIHWACFLRQNDIIKTLLNKNCPLNKGPQASALYEFNTTQGPLIFEHAQKGILSSEPYAHCIPETLMYIAEICTNLNWNHVQPHNHHEAFWESRNKIAIEPLILLELKKVSFSSVSNHNTLFKHNHTPANDNSSANHPNDPLQQHFRKPK